MNLFQIPASLPEEECSEILASGKDWRIERIISNGQKSPEDFWYDQEEDEWLCLLQGEAVIGYREGEEILLQRGDPLFIPRHQRHQIRFTSQNPPVIWLCFFCKEK